MRSIYSEEEWAEANQQKEEGTLETYTYEDDDGKVIYRFFKRQAGLVNNEMYFDIVSYRGAQGPYIQYAKAEKQEVLFTRFMNEFEKYCEQEKIIAEFAKLDPWDEYSETVQKMYGASYYGNFYCTSLEGDFYKLEYNRRARRSISKARENGVTVRFDFNGENIKQFLQLYMNTEEKYHISSYYQFTEADIQRYFRKLENCFLVNAYLEEEIIASAVAVMGKDIEHYLFLGVNPLYSNLQANSLMTYETALYGQQKGRKLFDMGGGIPGGGVEQFKRNFISEKGVWNYYAVKKIRNDEIYETLVKRKDNIKNYKFFPLYRG
ncbi:GNAT family N-acetyltransferase [Blautia sp. MSJ-9]|uniref:GNAT family N-acetyltransferase n=1 Tax=Blautia sp. MSJ-9 TaxID=2841511 RepID=UPI001C0FB7CA|nr:GNAT family N-acetyltransferase [Blautia sp. MSJ-9]MBU5681111.1 GNAT family N-acetyltransferase [Blautia sp. MSJ-9]